MDSTKKYQNPSPEKTASFVSKLFFCWILPFFKFGYKNDLQVSDVYNVVDSDYSGTLGDELQRNWEIELKRAASSNVQPSLKRAIFKTFAKSFSLYGLLLFFQVVILKSLQPIVLAAYIRYFGNSSQSTIIGWLLGFAIVILSFTSILIMHHCHIGCRRIGMRIRVACCSLVYRKLLKLHQSSLSVTSASEVANLISNDVERFDLASNYLHYIWIMPFQFVAACLIMFNSVGLATLTGMIAITLQAIPLQGYLFRLQGKLKSQIALKTAYRVKIISEIVTAIQVIKIYAWEKPFERIVDIARNVEIDYVTKNSYIKSFTTSASIFTERLALYLTMITYVMLGHALTGEVAFPMSLLFTTVQLYMCIYFPYALSACCEAKATVQKLEKFLALDENKSTDDNPEKDKSGAIVISQVSASLVPNPITDTLSDINLEISAGTLCCIVSNEGTEKSSFIQMLLKELPVKSGQLEISGTISYASHKPWLFMSSVRDNIVFGHSYNEKRYDNVVNVCGLDNDFLQFPFRDSSLIGEKGVYISPGQKVRINLARAVYTEADIYLLDDPLSTVDTYHGEHLFEKCIVKYLNNKTRVLVTHQLEYLKRADMIVVIDNGKIEKVGTFNEIAENVLATIEQFKEGKGKANKLEEEKRERLQTTDIVASFISKDEEPEETQELIEKEVVTLSTYVEYCRACGSKFVLIFLAVLLILGQMACNACDMWLTKWANREESRHLETTMDVPSTSDLANKTPAEDFSNGVSPVDDANSVHVNQVLYTIIYSIFIIAAVVLTLVRSIYFYRICVNASRVLHNTMFANVLKAPMRFFDTNPPERILNRFSKDTAAVDQILPPAVIGTTQVSLVICGILMMIFIVSPSMITPAIILGYVFYRLKLFYLKRVLDIQRLDAVTRAPIFSHISATLDGISTIRASNAQRIVVSEFDALQDQHSSTRFLFLAYTEAFGLCLDITSIIFLFLATFQFLIFKDTSYGGDVGLVITSSLILIGMLQLVPTLSADIKRNMTSVKNMLQYTNLQGEDEDGSPKQPARDWPHSGKIVFQNVSLRYAPEEPLVLDQVSILIEAKQKIGIVGERGGGKSSLIATLLRLAPFEGTIEIDGVDTSTIPLEDLRSNISVIPEEPILFFGTVRYNLDPFEKATDEDLWKALEDVELKTSIESLDQNVGDEGLNFSVDQRLLICLARAILSKNKVLIVDTSANVDPQIDSLIQNVLHEKFNDCTVLTITNKLNTIMDSDKVVVIVSGKVIEYAPPHKLLSDPAAFFTKMVKETGVAMEATLRKTAQELYDSKHYTSVEDVIRDAMEEEN